MKREEEELGRVEVVFCPHIFPYMKHSIEFLVGDNIFMTKVINVKI